MANWIDTRDLRDAIAHGERVDDPANNRVRYRHDGVVYVTEVRESFAQIERRAGQAERRAEQQRKEAKAKAQKEEQEAQAVRDARKAGTLPAGGVEWPKGCCYGANR